VYSLKLKLTVTIITESEFVGQGDDRGGALDSLTEFLHWYMNMRLRNAVRAGKT
jgi:hypothetical protein